MQELIELALKKIENLEKLIEKHYQMLNVDNELDFIVKGTYVTEEEVNKIVNGEY